MARKQRKVIPERVPTKRQLSKWQREEKIRRIAIIASVVFLAGILSWVGYGYYQDYKSNPLHEVVIKVNGVPFTMEYFVKALDVSTVGMNSTILRLYGSYLASSVADSIISAELLKQGAEKLNIRVTSGEVSARLKEYGLPDDKIYRDMIAAALLEQRLRGYFGSNITDTMNQAQVQAMLVESEEVAKEVISKVKAGGNFTALVEEYSCNSTIQGDLGLLPEELMPNTLIANVAFNLTTGEVSRPIYDATAVKSLGYWIIKVTDRQDEKIKPWVMLLGSEEEASWIRAELTAGGNFSSLAQTHSQHESKDKGGELDWLAPGEMGSDVFDRVAFNMTLNELSEPVKDESVQTTGGYWIVMVMDRGNYPVSDELRNRLIDHRYNAWRQRFAEESTIETYLEPAKLQWAVNKVLEKR